MFCPVQHVLNICPLNISQTRQILSLGGIHRGECDGHSIPPVCFFPTPSPSMYNHLTPESAIECSQASHISLRKVCIRSVSTEHYVRPGNKEIVTTLPSFPDLCMFVTCSLKSCANFRAASIEHTRTWEQGFDQPGPYQMLYRQLLHAPS